jgi:hypothetical protein
MANTIPYVVTGGLGLYGVPPSANVKLFVTDGFVTTPAATFTLTAEVAAYGLTGSPAGAWAARKLAATASAYTLASLPLPLIRNRTVVTLGSAYAWGGFTATLRSGRKVPSTVSAYTLTGSAVILTHTIPTSPANPWLSYHLMRA